MKRDQLQAYVASADFKMERRGAEPNTLFMFMRAAQNQIMIFGLTVGKEHMKIRQKRLVQ